MHACRPAGRSSPCCFFPACVSLFHRPNGESLSREVGSNLRDPLQTLPTWLPLGPNRLHSTCSSSSPSGWRDSRSLQCKSLWKSHSCPKSRNRKLRPWMTTNWSCGLMSELLLRRKEQCFFSPKTRQSDVFVPVVRMYLTTYVCLYRIDCAAVCNLSQSNLSAEALKLTYRVRQLDDTTGKTASRTRTGAWRTKEILGPLKNIGSFEAYLRILRVQIQLIPPNW